MYILIKYLVSAAIVVGVSELGKRSPALGGLLASLPLTAYLGVLWLYSETDDTQRIAARAQSIFWLVLSSLSLFIVLAWLLRHGLTFLPSLAIATLVTLIAYGLMVAGLRQGGMSL